MDYVTDFVLENQDLEVSMYGKWAKILKIVKNTVVNQDENPIEEIDRNDNEPGLEDSRGGVLEVEETERRLVAKEAERILGGGRERRDEVRGQENQRTNMAKTDGRVRVGRQEQIGSKGGETQSYRTGYSFKKNVSEEQQLENRDQSGARKNTSINQTNRQTRSTGRGGRQSK